MLQGPSTSFVWSIDLAVLAVILVFCAGADSVWAQTAAPLRITVEAGEFTRTRTAVSFEAPPLPENAALRDDAGALIPLQVGPDGRYWFILDHLEQGRSQSYAVVNDSSGRTSKQPIQASEEDGRVRFSIDREHVIRYNFTPTNLPHDSVDTVYRRGGYIHPVYSPAGVQLTDDYPPNHLHHHGIWAAWTKTEFQGRTPDFWNVGDRTGTVEPVALDSVWSGPVFGGLKARHRYIDLSAGDPVNALDEDWTILVYASPSDDVRVFDLNVTQTTIGGTTLHLPEYRYGGVGFRGHRQWDGEENTFFLTSEGRGRSDGHATRARWCHIGGLVDGRLAGIAVLDHPENFRSPQPMRIHPNEPFFNYAPSQLGDWSMRPGEVYSARYRFITYDGEANPGLIDRYWNDFANPPVVTLQYE